MQEEINRRLIDHGSSILLSPTTTAVKNLRNESVLGKIILCGDTMYDLLLSEKDKISDRRLFLKITNLLGISERNFAVLTIHRRENLLNPGNLQRILNAIKETGIICLFPIHPHTQKIVNTAKIIIPDNIKLMDPLSYRDFLCLVAFSGLVITDSGGLQKEALILNVPCVTLRNSTEWIETVEHQANKIVGSNPDLINPAIIEMYKKPVKTDVRVYGDGKAAYKIIKELIDNIPVIPTIPDL